MFFRMIYDDTLAQAAYLIGCQRTGEAILIDPERDIDRYLKAAQVKAAGLWPRVRSVQITLTFANPLARPGEPATVAWVQTIDLMNGRGP